MEPKTAENLKHCVLLTLGVILFGVGTVLLIFLPSETQKGSLFSWGGFIRTTGTVMMVCELCMLLWNYCKETRRQSSATQNTVPESIQVSEIEDVCEASSEPPTYDVVMASDQPPRYSFALRRLEAQNARNNISPEKPMAKANVAESNS